MLHNDSLDMMGFFVGSFNKQFMCEVEGAEFHVEMSFLPASVMKVCGLRFKEWRHHRTIDIDSPEGCSCWPVSFNFTV